MKEYFKNKAVQSAALGLIILGIVFAILLAFVTNGAKADEAAALPAPPTEVQAEVVEEDEGWLSEKYRKLKEWATTPEAVETTPPPTTTEAVTAVVDQPTVEEAKKKTDK
jgi:hypothetical protein